MGVFTKTKKELEMTSQDALVARCERFSEGSGCSGYLFQVFDPYGADEDEGTLYVYFCKKHWLELDH